MSDFLERISHFSPKRLALLADGLQERVTALEARLAEAGGSGAREPIAIVGIGCRFPGGADTPERFWTLVRDGVDAITEVPPQRWAIDDFYDADPDAPGKMNTRWGGFVGDVDGFDPHFFGVSPREARSMDPQQRLLLEVAWAALEHAGIPADRLEGSRTGVFIGMSAGDYYQLLRDGGKESFDAYTASGIAHSIASGRLSYVLGTRGPSLSIDTACSSSLVAIHEAVMSLRRGECDAALAGGVNLILTPDVSVALSRSHMMAPDGRCKTFDARADGFVRSEGCGVLVLKRLSDAQAAGDNIVALIRGSAANQDGRSNGLTAPNGPSQEAVLREALADARVDPARVGFVEAHGTGTSLGDPIEVQALAKVLGEPRQAGDAPLLLGSVKANVGHMEAAAGVGGVIKLALALRHGQVPGQPHVQTLNPYIPWDDLAVRVPTALTPWPGGTGPRLGGVSSFGFSGTNVHLVMEQAPEPAPAPAPAGPDRPLHLLTATARQDGALRALAAAYAEALDGAGASLADFAYSANTGRAPFAHRLSVLAASPQEAALRLRAHLAGEDPPGVFAATAGARAPKIAFLFTGQGAQHAGMARELFASEPVFRAALERCAGGLDAQLPRPLLEVLFAPEGDGAIDDTAFTQPALFALEYALAQLWLSWGVRPAAVMGHSVGEYVAACVAGVFGLDDALQLIAARGRLMGALPRDGGMLAVMAEPARVAALIGAWPRELSIAAVNGPQNVVVSGLLRAIEAVEAQCQAQGLRCSRLKVSHAFHSPLMEPMLAEFERLVASVDLRAPRIELISNLTGRPVGEAITRPGYWREHVREAVQFAPAVQALAQAGVEVFLEVGPHPTLLGLGQACLPEGSGDGQRHWLPSLRRGRGDWESLLGSLARLHGLGAAIDWTAFDAGRARRRVALPGYPFQRERYWAPDDHAPARGAEPRPAALHPLLGREVAQSLTSDRLFETRWGLAVQPWLRDHRILGRWLLPSPVYMEMARAAAQRQFGDGPVEIRDFVVHRAMPLHGDEPVRAQLVLGAPEAGVSALRIAAFDAEGGGWPVNASARLAAATASVPAHEAPAAIAARLGEAIDVDHYYGWLKTLGLEFGPLFRGVESIRRGEGEVLARLSWPDGLSPEAGLLWHPACLDACFHVIGAGLPQQGATLDQAFLLLQVDRIHLDRAPGRAVWNHVRLRPGEGRDPARAETFSADLTLLDDAGAVLARFEGMHFKRARPEALAPQGRVPASVRRMLHEIVWRELPPNAAGAASPVAIAQALGPRVDELARQHGLDRYAGFLPELDALAADYVRQALHGLGLDPRPGEALGPAAALATRLGVLPRHGRLFERMLGMLVEDGALARDAGGYSVRHWPGAGDPEARYHDLLARFADCDAELNLTARCARELAAVLRGQADPLALLFPGGSLADTERLYQHSPPAQVYNALIADALAAIAAAWPAGRPLRVLEIGAGTGSTTHHVLSRLPTANLDYTFTDVSPLFLHRAREKFAAHGFMRYAVLDIGAAPAGQGFAEAAYDVVIGANVLHATPDLDTTMDHVRRLLAPGGTLVLLEGTTPQRFGDLTVGLLEGWWAYADTQRRQYALMPRGAWLDLFQQHGLGEPAALPGDTPHPVLQQQAVFLARQPLAEAKAHAARRWLLLPDAAGLQQALARELRARGDEVRVLAEGPAGLAAALGEGPWQGVVQLQPLDARLDEALDPDAVEQQQQRLIGGLLPTVQTLAAQAGSADGAPGLWLVTRGAQAARANDSADAAQATAWGLGHVVAVEHPELRCVRLDLDPASGDAEAARQLADELQSPSREDQIARRGGARLARRLVRHDAATAPAGGPTRLAADRAYLVTGGLRGLGLRVAAWLVERGARHLVLMGRQAPDARALAVIEGLRGQGAQVLAARGDVARRADLQRVLAEAAALAPLAGVVHAAGVLDDGVIAAQTWPRFATVMGPKVRGSWNLHTLCPDLDFLVLFSSGASVAGPAGQSNHAAANAFEDALAWYRQARGLPTVSINWGPWAEIGAAADRRLDKPGSLRAIAPADGLAALEHAMRRSAPGALFPNAQLAVLDSDWAHLADGAPPLFGELLRGLARPGQVPAPGQTAAAPEPSLRERLASAAANRRKTLLRDHVRQLTVKVLGLQRGEDLDVTEPLRQLGLDSLMAVELRNRLGQAVGRTLPATLTFDHPSVAALTEHLAREVFADLMPAAGAPAPQVPVPNPAPTAAPTPAAAPDVGSFDELSEDELAQQLMRRLDGLG
ncbi:MULTISPECIES: type I polyketide synthase [unclassified Hydrogenophaga]|uniref:type I polyketide synthase n=1 Tax=unclassified Hydrogenophaga TaxID=2610897 RepID=UPI000878EF38|nr:MULTISPECIES: type I polyketide synthase [unclassified Hydrogenophaga]MBN9373331.1 type I polyketide synthase [Hydrogenophaga sp.]OJV51231.1 MAG: hypothetical protein BGO22_17715 [Hydrogenophaga sp. 70-12]